MARPPFGLSGVSIGTTTFWPGVSTTSAAICGDRPAVDGRLVAVEQARALEQLAHDQRDAAGLVHVERGVAAARPHVGDERGPVGDRAELVDVERDAELVGDRQQVQDAVGRAAGRGHAGDPVLERRAGHDRRRPDVAADEVHDQLAGSVGRRASLAGSSAGMPLRPAGESPMNSMHRAHRVGRVLAAAGARSGAGRVLDLVQLVERDLAGPVGADRLVDATRRSPFRWPLVDARVDRPVVEDETRHVEPAERHRRAGHRLVAGRRGRRRRRAAGRGRPARSSRR